MMIRNTRWVLGSALVAMFCVASAGYWLALLDPAAVPGAAAVVVVPLEPPAGAGARLPRFAALPGGAVLSWVEPVATGGHVLRVARYRNGRFEPPNEVARGTDWFVNWADFPSVVPVATDVWVAHWLAKHSRATHVYDYGIAMAMSRDGGFSWTRLPAPHADVGPTEQGFAAISPAPAGADLVWLDGRAGDERHTFALRTTHIDRQGHFAAETVLDADICSCCWPALARTRGGLWTAYRGRTTDEIRDFQLRQRVDGIWSAPVPLAGEGWRIAGCPTNGVSLAARGERLAAAWFTAADGLARVRVGFIRDGAAALDAVYDIDSATPVGRAAIAWLDADTAAVLHIAAPAAGSTRGDLRLTEVTAAGVGRTTTVARVPANRDSGVPQLIVVADGLLAAWTETAPAYGIRSLRIVTSP